MKKTLAIVGIALLVLVVGAGGCVYTGYNRAVGLDEQVKNQWAQVENQLQRRYDLVPNLVETVKGVAGQEKDVFLGIAKSREKYFQASTVPEKAKAAGEFESALSRLLVFSENYPALKSNESFLKLQDQLEGTENRLAVERKRYNDTVNELNLYSRQLLGQFFCRLAGVQAAEYFKVEEAAKKNPKVDFSKPS